MTTFTKYGALLLVGISLLGACKKEDEGGSMSVVMSGSSGDFNTVNVAVKKVDVHYEDQHVGNGGWVSLSSYDTGCSFNHEANNGSQVCYDKKLPLGKIDQLRLTFGGNNTLVNSHGDTLQATLSDGTDGVKLIAFSSELKTDRYMELEMEFDCKKSIARSDNNTYSMDPVLSIKRVGWR